MVPLMSQVAWEWCCFELREKVARFQDTGPSLCWLSKSDNKILEILNQKLRAALESLLNQPAEEEDWHPGSEVQMLDPVHPSLFQLVS